MNARMIAVACLGAILLGAGGARAVNIETVHVGNAGNMADTRDGLYLGGVPFEYNIGKYEVTAGQYCEFLNAVAATDTYELYRVGRSGICPGQIERTGSAGSYSYSVAADWANRPMNYVTFWSACRFANWLHNGQPSGAQDLTTTEDGSYFLNGVNQVAGREKGWTWAIPGEPEWYKAAYHKNDGVTGNYFDYATSSNIPPSNDLIDPDPGNNATFDDGSSTIGSPYYRTEVGEHENSESPYGTFDQCGNVWEWTHASPWYTTGHMYWGGGYGSSDFFLPRYDRYDYNDIPPSAFHFPIAAPYIGFRLIQIPEPTTMVILALGGTGMLRKRRSVRG